LAKRRVLKAETIDQFVIKILIGKPLHICGGTRTFIFMMKMLLRKKST
jgi:hypothetical protein